MKHRKQFASWGEFLEFAENRKAVSRFQNSRSTGEHRTEWTGTRNLQEALNLARYGWAEGETRARKIADVLFERVTNLIEREDMVHDVVGNSLDISAYLNDDPECWTRQESHIEEGRAVRIFRLVYNNHASASISADTLMAKGAAIAALVRALEYAGHRVEVQCLPFVISDAPGYEARVLLKPAEQDMDFGRMVFALAHPSTFRRLGFSCFEADPLMSEVGSGYGNPGDADASERGDIYIGRSYYGEPQWTNQESVIKWILETLKGQGITIREA